ncbi:MAG: chromate efflux transporter [Crocinitomicaceae bacterium]|nr:chromate efflux transporter [Crocinitomicaceae bacterium]
MKDNKNNIKEVAKVFFKLGCFAFGGPAAHIALMEEEVVSKRKWMSKEHFLDLIGATNLIPGPNSTEMTMHCGHERAGYAGLIIAGLSFIFPAIIITGFLAFIYIEYGQIPAIAPFFIGIKPAVLAIILSAIIKLGKKALKNVELWVIGIAVLVFALFGFNEVFLLLIAGILGAIYFTIKANSTTTEKKSLLPFLLVNGVASTATSLTTIKIFWTFLKVGSVLYGSGYVLFAYLDVELVEAGWLSRQQLLDAIAIGQFTPGPVLSSATFIGYQLNGIWGALAATTGIFLPSFIFVLILNPLIPKMRKSVFLSHFLNSVNVAAVSIMAGVLYIMTIETVIDWRSILIAGISTFLTFFVPKVNAILTIMIGALLGYALYLI